MPVTPADLEKIRKTAVQAREGIKMRSYPHPLPPKILKQKGLRMWLKQAQSSELKPQYEKKKTTRMKEKSIQGSMFRNLRLNHKVIHNQIPSGFEELHSTGNVSQLTSCF
jgi:hypothetical protein